MEYINYTLPEFCFLDANSHEGNLLEDRTVLQHIRSYTIMEVIALDDVEMHDFKHPTYKFDYKNHFGVTEKHMLIVHFSLAWETSMPLNDTLMEIFEKTAAWYCNYLKWEDENISGEHKSTFQ